LFPESDEPQSCLDIALAELENWLKANKHTKPDVSQAVKYIYINLNIGYGDETNLFNNEISWCAN